MMAIAAWGSFLAALTSATVAALTYKARQDAARRAEMWGWVQGSARLQTDQACLGIYIRNDGPGPARDIGLSVFPSATADASTDDLLMEHGPLPDWLQPGDHCTVWVDVVLPDAMQTLQLSWREAASGTPRRRLLVAGGGH